jgi:DNA polymerase III subunit epsilon
MELTIGAIIIASVLFIVFIVKSSDRSTLERDPEERSSACLQVAPTQLVRVSEETEPAPYIAYSAPESFNFQMSGRALKANGTSFLPSEFVVFDLETTGLSASANEIIEFGAIRVARNAESHLTFQSLVKPGCKVSSRITKITGITQEMLNSQGRPISQVLPLFLDFIGDLPLVTFNASFDMGFLRQAAKKRGLSVPNPYTCALQISRKAWPDTSHKLVDLARIHNLQMVDSHRALGDCGRTVHIFIQAVELRSGKIQWSN